MNNFTFTNPTAIFFGAGAISHLGSQVAKYGTKVLLVYGGGSIVSNGVYAQVKEELATINATVIELSGVDPNPRLSTVKDGIALCRTHHIDFILAVGGGSVIDAAKAIAAGVHYDGDPWDFLIRKASVTSALPLGAVLTLAATGTEMNGNSVITNWDLQQKRGFASPLLYPKFSILDPAYTFSVPRHQTVNGIVDMMSHVFEQYFSLTQDTPLQERLCESILQTIIENAEIALEQPTHYAARANLMWCGTLALNGGLISAGMVGDWASHGIEHELSAIYDIPHGAGLAIVYPNWMKYVYDARPERFAQLATRVWGIAAENKTIEQLAQACIEETKSFFTRIGAPSSLAYYNIGAENFEKMATQAVRFGPIGNFKKLNKDDIVAIYQLCL